MNSNTNTITAFLLRHRRRHIFMRVVNAGATIALATMVFWILCALLFAALPWTALPYAFDLSVLVAVVAGLGTLCWILFVRPTRLRDVALLLELHGEGTHQLLGISTELSDGAKGASCALTEHALEKAATSLDRYPRHVPGLLKWQRLATTAVIAVVCGAIFLFAQPRLLDFWALPFTSFRAVAATVEPGTVSVPRGSRHTLSCMPVSVSYPSARLTMNELSTKRTHTMLLRPQGGQAFTFETDSLEESFLYSFELGGSTFGPETISVVPPPVLHSLKIQVTPPAYTRKQPSQLPEGKGSFAVYAGSHARFSVQSMHGLSRASYVPAEGKTVSLEVTDGSAEGTIRVWRGGSYTFSLMDTLAQINDSLPSFFIDILPDYPPAVRIVKPGRNIDLSPSQVETLWVEGVDDLGIRELACEFRRSGDPDTAIGVWDLSKDKGAPTVLRKQLAWDLTPLSLYPGDTVYYWARVRDSKPFGKPQISVSDTFWFRVPSFQEIHERIANRESRTEKTLSGVKQAQEKMQKQLQHFLSSAKGKKELSWEEKKILEDLGKNVKSQMDSLNNAVENLKKSVEEMKEEGRLGEEILEKIDEVRKAVEDLVKQYGDSLLFDAPKPDEKVGWQDMKMAVEKMEKMLPRLEEQLENTLQYLETLKKDRELAELSARAEHLAEEQHKLAANQSDNKLGQQEKLSEDIQDMLDEMRKKMDELGFDKEMSPNSESSKHVDSLLRRMQNLMANSTQPQDPMMNQMSAALQSLSQDLLSMLSTAMMAQALHDRDKLLEMAQDALDLAEWQKAIEELLRQTEDQQNAAMNQQALKDALQKAMQKLDELLAAPPAMLQGLMGQANDAMNAMNGALAAMSGGKAPGPGSGGGAGGALNSLANQLMAAASGMQKQCQGGSPSGMGGGMMPGLRKLSGKQAAINSATQSLLQQMLSKGTREGGQAQSMGARGQARESAMRAQKELADQLRQLGEQYGGTEAGGGLEKRVKELEEEARRLAEMLKNPRQDVADRQERFLVRLLQTTLSMHKQDEGKEERKSTSAATIYSQTSADRSANDITNADTFYRIRTKALDGNYPEPYRMQIQAYFDSLGVLFLKE